MPEFADLRFDFSDPCFKLLLLGVILSHELFKLSVGYLAGCVALIEFFDEIIQFCNTLFCGYKLLFAVGLHNCLTGTCKLFDLL